MDNYRKTFPHKMQYFMSVENLSQAELARRLHVSTATINHWVNGKKIPRADYMDRLCAVLNCRRADLVENDPPPQASESIVTEFYNLEPSQQKTVADLITMYLTENRKQVV